MAVRNGAPYLRATLDSLLAQTFTSFELIVINDGSEDETATILDGWPDSRIVRLANQQSLGLAASLNLGIDQARGAFIARMDADDLARPDRLERQLAFLREHPDVVILGSACDLIDDSGRYIETQRQPERDEDIRWQMLFHNAFSHSSVMTRRTVFEGGMRYEATLAFAQDYDLWSRVLDCGKAANMNEALISLRQHSSSMSAQARARQQMIADGVALKNIELALGRAVKPHAVSLLRAWYYGLPLRLDGESNDAIELMVALLRCGACVQTRENWVARLLGHPDASLVRFAPALLPLAPRRALGALWRRFLGRTSARAEKYRLPAT